MGRALRALPVGLYAVYASTTGCIATLLPQFNHRLCHHISATIQPQVVPRLRRASITSPRFARLGGFLFNRGTKSNPDFELLHILLKVELKGVPMVYPL